MCEHQPCEQPRFAGRGADQHGGGLHAVEHPTRRPSLNAVSAHTPATSHSPTRQASHVIGPSVRSRASPRTGPSVTAMIQLVASSTRSTCTRTAGVMGSAVACSTTRPPKCHASGSRQRCCGSRRAMAAPDASTRWGVGGSTATSGQRPSTVRPSSEYACTQPSSIDSSAPRMAQRRWGAIEPASPSSNSLDGGARNRRFGLLEIVG